MLTALATALQAGDASALSRIYDCCRGDVLQVFTRWVPSEAEDLKQELFEKLPRTIAGYRATGRFPPWLGGVARNMARQEVRDLGRGPRSRFETGVDIVASTDPSTLIRQVLYHPARPTPDGRTVLVLSPLEFLAATSRLIPPPRVHHHRYHGVLAPNAGPRAARACPLPAENATPFGAQPSHRGTYRSRTHAPMMSIPYPPARVSMASRTLIALTMALAACSSDSPSAPSPATPGTRWSGNGHFYQLMFCPGSPSPQQCSWEEARALAQGVGAGWDLATITSAGENAFVESLFGTTASACNVVRTTLNSGPWIGAYLAGPNRANYAWVSGEPFSFTDWGPNEPFGNGDRISYADWSAPYCGDGAGIAWNDIGSGRFDGPVAFIAESNTR